MLEIPSICGIEGLEVDKSLEGEYAILAASKNELLIAPESHTVTDYGKLKKEYEEINKNFKLIKVSQQYL